jgi:hypothetical protein
MQGDELATALVQVGSEGPERQEDRVQAKPNAPRTGDYAICVRSITLYQPPDVFQPPEVG